MCLAGERRVPVAPDTQCVRARWKIRKHKATVCTGAYDAITPGSFRSALILGIERYFCLGYRLARVRANNPSRNLPRRLLFNLREIVCLSGDGSRCPRQPRANTERSSSANREPNPGTGL